MKTPHSPQQVDHGQNVQPAQDLNFADDHRVPFP